MSNYTGIQCPVCNKRFEEASDVVVCPVCGAPHHRSCYAQKNQCAFLAEHQSGMEWQAPADATPPPKDKSPATHICGQCGSANGGESIFCQVCGNRLEGGLTASRSSNTSGGNAQKQDGSLYGPGGFQIPLDPQIYIYGGVSPEEEMEGVLVRDLAVYLGPNSAYYLPRFMRIHKKLSNFSVNFAAMFLSFFYYFYRKMYLIGGILLGLFAICLVPYCLYIREMLPELMKQPEFISVLSRAGIVLSLPTTEVDMAAVTLFGRLSNIAWSIFMFAGFACSMFANSFYYRKAVSAVQKIRDHYANKMDPSHYNLALAYQGGVSVLAVLLVVGLAFAVYSLSASFAFRGLF